MAGWSGKGCAGVACGGDGWVVVGGVVGWVGVLWYVDG